MDAMRQGDEGVLSLAIQQLAELLEERFGARQLPPCFLVIQHRVILVADAADRVERARVNNLAQDTAVQKAQLIDRCDLYVSPAATSRGSAPFGTRCGLFFALVRWR
jgi:hypothetical protein